MDIEKEMLRYEVRNCRENIKFYEQELRLTRGKLKRLTSKAPQP